ALADRDSFEPDGAEGKRAREEQALQLLERSFAEPTLHGFALLLRSDLLVRLGRYDRAQAAVDAAAKLSPPPTASAMLEAKVAVGIGRKRFDETLKLIEAAPSEGETKDLLVIRVRLAELAAHPAGPGRDASEDDAFRRAGELRKMGKPEARQAVVALA